LNDEDKDNLNNKTMKDNYESSTSLTDNESNHEYKREFDDNEKELIGKLESNQNLNTYIESIKGTSNEDLKEIENEIQRNYKEEDEKAIHNKTEAIISKVIEGTETIDEKEQVNLDKVIKNSIKEISNISDDSDTTNKEYIEKLKTAYSKLYKILTNSRNNELYLIKRCHELTTDIVANATKVQSAIQMTYESRKSAILMKTELEKAWKLLEISNQNEAIAQDALLQIKSDYTLVRRLAVEAGVPTESFTNEGDNEEKKLDSNLDTVLKEKYEVERKLTSSNNKILELENTQKDLKKKIEQLLCNIDDQRTTMMDMKEQYITLQSKYNRLERNRVEDSQKLQNLQSTVEKKDKEIDEARHEMENYKEKENDYEQKLKDEKYAHDLTNKEKDEMEQSLINANQEIEEHIITYTKITTEKQNLKNELKNIEEEYQKVKEDNKNLNKTKDTIQKKYKQSEELKLENEKQIALLKTINGNVLHEVDNLKKEISGLKKQNEDLLRERDLINKSYIKSLKAIQRQTNLVKLGEQTKKNLEFEIIKCQEEAAKMRKIIYSLEKERNLKVVEISHIKEMQESKEEELKINNLQLLDSNKKIIETEKKLCEQQKLYESVRADRNIYSKNLIEAQDEVQDLKQKYNILNHQLEQLKEEVSIKEHAIVTSHFEISRLEKEKDNLKFQISRIQQLYEKSQEMAQSQILEQNQLRRVIIEADKEKMKQRKELENLVQQRDFLDNFQKKLNDEIVLLYEKLKIQSSALSKGEMQYQDRIEDIRVLKLEIKKLRSEKALLQTETRNIAKLKAEVFYLQKEYLRETTKVKVLEEELESPMNVHRWRKLAAADPTSFELITKTQTLQKRLIAKTEEVVEKELLLQQTKKLYEEVKEMLRRAPGPEVLMNLRKFKEALRYKTREAKALASELNMYHSQINEYKLEIERLNKEIQDLKKKFYSKIQRLTRKNNNKIIPIDIKKNIGNIKRTGGGFKFDLQNPHHEESEEMYSLTEQVVNSNNNLVTV
jgi:chromosome segregation ATPase